MNSDGSGLSALTATSMQLSSSPPNIGLLERVGSMNSVGSTGPVVPPQRSPGGGSALFERMWSQNSMMSTGSGSAAAANAMATVDRLAPSSGGNAADDGAYGRALDSLAAEFLNDSF